MKKRKIKKGDNVILIAGKDKGQQGQVLRVFADDRVLVQGLNRCKKHVKPNPKKNEQGGIIEKEMPLNISNVGLVNPATGKADRVGIKVLKDGRRVRYFKSNEEVIDK